MPSLRPVYVRLTYGQKQELREYYAGASNCSYSDLGAWATDRFKLPHPPARATLYRALQQPMTNLRSSTKSARDVASTLLEQRLINWIRKCEELQLPVVTGATICEKAARLRDEIVLTASAEVSTKLKKLSFSNGWLYKFQLRHGLSSKRVHGEAASVDIDAVSNGRGVLQELTAPYARCDIFNFDETAYFYCVPPKTSITSRPLAGRKNSKKRITVAVACNADGSIKMPLLFIGSSRQPRCFKGKSGTELNIDYANTPKAWMNTVLFESWVVRFDAKMRAKNRHVLLLLDNASSHRVAEPLSHVTLQMLPPNTTAYLQPQDAGIIRQFKAEISKCQTKHAVDYLDKTLEEAEAEGRECQPSDVADIYSVDILTAIRWAEVAWERVTKQTIQICWCHTQILDDDMYELIDSLGKIQI
jgi:hypothetical protein